MKYYVPINIKNLEIIQQKVFELFPKSEINNTNLFYIPNNVELFLNIPELKIELDNLGWTNYISSFGFYIIQPMLETTIHIDSGPSVYSFNIPILNFNNTYVNFYTTSTEPTKKFTPNGVSYYYYNPKLCESVDKLEMITPHVVKIKHPHNVVTKPLAPTVLNSAPRITLLIRLKPELFIEDLFV
jgi:hypothetical protein